MPGATKNNPSDKSIQEAKVETLDRFVSTLAVLTLLVSNFLSKLNIKKTPPGSQ